MTLLCWVLWSCATAPTEPYVGPVEVSPCEDPVGQGPCVVARADVHNPTDAPLHARLTWRLDGPSAAPRVSPIDLGPGERVTVTRHLQYLGAELRVFAPTTCSGAHCVRFRGHGIPLRSSLESRPEDPAPGPIPRHRRDTPERACRTLASEPTGTVSTWRCDDLHGEGRASSTLTLVELPAMPPEPARAAMLDRFVQQGMGPAETEPGAPRIRRSLLDAPPTVQTVSADDGGRWTIRRSEGVLEVSSLMGTHQQPLWAWVAWRDCPSGSGLVASGKLGTELSVLSVEGDEDVRRAAMWDFLVGAPERGVPGVLAAVRCGAD